MELKQGMNLHNFTVTAVRPIPGKDAQLVQMRYEKTGTELVWVKSKEANKLFGIAFKTIPEDDTGVFHILEHSVLCGSAKFPVKEPFVELLKSSMNTFLNAMTFPDKTFYPVSSRNRQDFLNLTEVYLDAVFAPNILTNPNIFRQEGWHYELNDGKLVYNGVVFNEMKGAMSSVDEVAERGIMHLLFPDNCYQYNSGGEPTAIPNLTYEQFIASYKKCYHPTNARIFLDGDIPVEETFAMLDAYLSPYEMGQVQQLEPQFPVSGAETLYYEAKNDGTPKAQLVLGKILGTFRDKTTLLARKVLCDVLAGNNEAPLKRALLETGLCQDVSLSMSDGLIQPFMSLRLHNLEQENIPKLEEVIRSTVRSLLENGIPQENLTASINSLSFHARQMREPQALLRGMHALDSWLYGGDPMLYLSYDDSIAELREMAARDGFRPLLEEMLLDETGLCRLTVLPSEDYGTQLRQAEAQRLAGEQAALSPAQLQEVADIQAAFTLWQQAPDTPENLAKLPQLSLSEISPEPLFFGTREDSCLGVPVLRHEAGTNGIVYLTAYFYLTDCTLEEITKMSMLDTLLGKLPAGGMDGATLQNRIKRDLGSLSFGLSFQAREDDPSRCTPVLAARCSVLQENLPLAEELMYQVLTATDFRQPERIRELVLQNELDGQQYCTMSGHALALGAVQAHFRACDAAQEANSGITFIHWVHDFSKNFDSLWEGYADFWAQKLATAVCRGRMVVSLTEETPSDPASFIARFPEGTKAPASVSYTTALPRKLGIRIPAQVSYASIGSHLTRAGMGYNGTARLVSNILSLSCLWNEVRVQGGAYGAGMRMGRSGGLVTYSYRDPSPERSLGVYRSMSQFVQDFAAAAPDITGFIISTVADTEPLIAPASQGRLADVQWFSGFTYEKAAQERKDLLEAKPQDLVRWCAALETLKDGPVCVVGYQEALDRCQAEGLTIYDI